MRILKLCDFDLNLNFFTHAALSDYLSYFVTV